MNHWKSACCNAPMLGMAIGDSLETPVACSKCKKLGKPVFDDLPQTIKNNKCSRCGDQLSESAVLMPDMKCRDGYCGPCAMKIMDEQEKEWWEEDLFWKVIFRNLTPETQEFIKEDVAKRIAESFRLERERILGMIEGMKIEEDKIGFGLSDIEVTAHNLVLKVLASKLKSSNFAGV